MNKKNQILFLLFVSFQLTFSQTDSVYYGEQSPKRKPSSDRAPKKFNLKDKLVYGGFVMPGYSVIANYGSIFYISASPNVGIKLTDKLMTGIGFNYNYMSFRPKLGGQYTSSLYGPSIFSRYLILENAFLQVQYEKLNQPNYSSGRAERAWVDYVLAGGGYYQRFSEHSGMLFSAMFNLTPNSNSVYANPIYQIGFVAGF